MPVLIPAYGHTYKTKAEVIEAYESEKNFEGDITMGFRLCSRRDITDSYVELRYGKHNQHVTVYHEKQDN